MFTYIGHAWERLRQCFDGRRTKPGACFRFFVVKAQRACYQCVHDESSAFGRIDERIADELAQTEVGGIPCFSCSVFVDPSEHAHRQAARDRCCDEYCCKAQQIHRAFVKQVHAGEERGGNTGFMTVRQFPG